MSLVTEMCVVVQMKKEEMLYLGFVCKNIGDNNYLVEQSGFWGHAKAEYVRTVSEKQILLC